jgi:hypothetical protein
MTVLLLAALLVRRPWLLLLVPVSALVFWDFGSVGLAVLWGLLLAVHIGFHALGR